MRRGSIKLHTTSSRCCEAIEAIAHGDTRSSRVVNRCIGDIDLPAGATIGAIVRDDEVLIAHDRLAIEHQDHVIMFLTDKRKIPISNGYFQCAYIL